MSAREAAAKFLLDSGGLKVSLVGEAPVEERGFCLYGLTEYLKENKVGKAIKAGLMAAVGTVMLSGALSFVEKNYQMDKIFEPPAMESVYTPPSPHADTMDKEEISELINSSMSNVDNLKKSLQNLGVLGVNEGKDAFIVNIEDPDSIKQVEQQIKDKFAGDTNMMNQTLKNLQDAINNAGNADTPFSASISGETNFFTIKPSSNGVLERIMEPLDLTEKEAKDMIQAFSDHEVQHMAVNVAVTNVTKALAMGDLSPDEIDSHPSARLLPSEYKEGLKNFEFKNPISEEQNDLYNKVKANGFKAADIQEAQEVQEIMKHMGENMQQISAWSNAEVKSFAFENFNEKLSDTYGSLIQIQQGNTHVVDHISEMRANGVDQMNDKVHDTRTVLKFISDNITPKMLDGMSPADLSRLATKIVQGVEFPNENNNEQNLKTELAALTSQDMSKGLDFKLNEFVMPKIDHISNALEKLRGGSYDIANNTISRLRR